MRKIGETEAGNVLLEISQERYAHLRMIVTVDEPEKKAQVATLAAPAPLVEFLNGFATAPTNGNVLLAGARAGKTWRTKGTKKTEKAKTGKAKRYPSQALKTKTCEQCKSLFHPKTSEKRCAMCRGMGPGKPTARAQRLVPRGTGSTSTEARATGDRKHEHRGSCHGKSDRSGRGDCRGGAARTRGGIGH